MILERNDGVQIKKLSGSGESKTFRQGLSQNVESIPVVMMLHGTAGTISLQASIIGDDDTFYEILKDIDLSLGSQHILNHAMSRNCKYKLVWTGAADMTVAFDNVEYVN